MEWINYKKAYEIVPQNWIIDCFTVYKISSEVIRFIENTIDNWRVQLIVGGKNLAELKILREIFQADAHNYL